MLNHKWLTAASLSALALCASALAVLAADIVYPTKVRKFPDIWTSWIEGGLSRVSGDPHIAGFTNPPFDLMPKPWGWQGAIGIDYRRGGTPWHLSAQFRYSVNDSNSGTSSQTATFDPGGTETATNKAYRRERNWAADVMVGYDLALMHLAQVKFGIRVAEIWGQTKGQATWCLLGPCFHQQTRTYEQTNRFFGIGPRLAIEGSYLLWDRWFFEYNGGVAGLTGRSSANQTVAITGVFGGENFLCLSGCPIAVSGSSINFVFNADVQGGLAYAFNRNAKVSVHYRAEGYWKALRGFDPPGSGTNLNRIYHGPTARLTVSF